MSSQITTAFVQQFNSNVIHLSQQKNSRVAPYVNKKSQSSEVEFFDRIGLVEAQEKIGRHADVTYADTPHSKRSVTLREYFHADIVDQEDKIKTLIDPEGEYSKAFAAAFARKMDDVVIDAMLGNAYSGKQGAVSSVALPNSQKLASVDGSTTTGVNLTLSTLIKLQEIFGLNEVEEGECYLALGSREKSHLLAITQVTSSDYAAIKALVNGDVDTFMGFKFIFVNRLPVTTATVAYNVVSGVVGSGTGTQPVGSRRCIAWKRDGVLMTTGISPMTKITELPSKHYANQVYMKMQIGAARMEEEKVVEILVKE